MTPKGRWPRLILAMDDFAASLESGVPMVLTGSFGGFGGMFFEAHPSESVARAHVGLHNVQNGTTLFRLKIEPITHIMPDGTECDP